MGDAIDVFLKDVFNNAGLVSRMKVVKKEF